MVGSAATLTHTFSFDPAAVRLTAQNGGTLLTLADEAQPCDTPGAPWLPAAYRTLLLPAGARVTDVRGEGDAALLLTNVTLAPTQPPQRRNAPKTAPVPMRAEAYAADAWLPSQPAQYLETQTMRGYTLAALRLNPVRYNAAQRAVTFARTLTVTVTYEIGAPAVQSPRNLAVFDAMARAAVANPELATARPATTRLAPRAAVDYLLITSQALSNAFAALVSQRAGRGLATSLMTIEAITTAYPGADTQQKIRNCITNFVYNKGTLYVVLGGDDTVVPDRDCYVTGPELESQMPTDLYFSGLDGTWNADGDSQYGETTDSVDMAPDVLVGRIPVRTAQQAADYVNKLIAFENNRPAALLEKMLIVGTETWDTYTGAGRPTDLLGDGHAEFRAGNHPSVSDAEIWSRRMYRDAITQYWRAATLQYFFDTLTSWDTTTAGDYAQTAANVQSKMNLGWGQVYFSDHGYESGWGLESGNYTTSEASSLNNRTVLVYTDACLSGHFDGTPEPCFSEGLLRNAAGGALVFIGCSRYGWGEPGSYDGGPSSVYAYKFYRRLLAPRSVSIGQAFAQHKADMATQCTVEGAERWIQFGLNLQGDPALLWGVVDSNKPPVLAHIGSKTVLAGSPLQFAVSALDTVDGDTITLTAGALPAWASFAVVSNKGSVSSVFSGVPPQAGIFEVMFSAQDKDGATNEMVRVTVGAMGLAPALMISEYGEGSSGNKYVELCNGTSNLVDLGGYVLKQQANGAGGFAYDLGLSGVVTAGHTYVIVCNQADATLRGKADVVTGSLCLQFTGNDALGLFRTNATLVDVVGEQGSAANWGRDVTLCRRPDVHQPASVYAPAEWELLPNDTWDDVGQHMIVPEPACMLVLGIAGWCRMRRR
jgi:hypothetical protein